MSFDSIGDLASSLVLSQASIKAKRSLLQLSQEVTTGTTSDVRGALRNDMSKQMDWEHSITKNRVLEKTLTEAMVRTQIKQSALGSISDTALTFATDANVALSAHTGASLNTVSANAKNALEQALSHLNSQAGGHSLFAGAGIDRPAMASMNDILASARSYVGASSSPTDIAQSINDWMNDPVDGFQTDAYTGSDQPSSLVRLSIDRTIEETSKADDPALKAVLEHLIVASLTTDETLVTSQVDKSALLRIASDGLRSSLSQLTELRANLGFVEAELTKGKVQAGTEISTSELLRAETLGVDEYETASKLQATELQLEKIYALTARSARMSLLEYLR